ncbi:MAG: TonB-dependent siderophore receptor [Methylomonas sp.]|nr:MAG: TonB-dependent siderophore receptor [Methylomonas sp.]
MLISMQSFSMSASELTKTFDIAPQSLNDALVSFAQQANIELLFSADSVRGLNSQNLQGRMTAEQGLKILLKDSGLNCRFINNHTAALLTPSSAAPGSDNPSLMDSLEVTGNRIHQPSGTDSNQYNPSLSADTENTDYRVTHTSSATRTDTPVKSIPQSIQIINRQLIDDQQTIMLSDALQNVSGVVARSVLFSPVIEGTLIRGFRAEQLTDGFTQYYNPGDRESTVNIERVEVLKGANAIFYSGGSGSAVGGVINVVSKLPHAKAAHEIGFTAGSYDFYQPRIDINHPINKNALFRVTAEYTTAASHIDVINTQRYNINPALVLTNNDTTTLTLQGKFSHWAQPEYQGLPATGTIAGNFKIDPRTYIGPTNIPDSESDSTAVWAKLEHQINQHWALDIRTRYAASQFNELVQTLYNIDSFTADTPLLPPSTWGLANAELFQQQRELSFSANAIGKFESGQFKNTLLIGGDHSVLNDDGFVEWALIDSVDLAQPPQFSTGYHHPGARDKNQFMTNTLYGAYLQWQSTIGGRLHTLTALRLGGLDIDFEDKVSRHASKTQILKFLPRAGVVYDLTDSVSAFAGYSEGMRGQPFVKFGDTPTPELSRQLEAGLKFDVSSQFSGQVAVYQIDREQVAVPNSTNPNSALFISAGRQRSQGIETDLLWQPFESLKLLGSYAHTNARFQGSAGGIADQNRVAWVPEDAGRLWANYHLPNPIPKGVSVGFGVTLNSGSYIAHDNAFKVGGYHSFDATIAYEKSIFRLALTAKNLSDNEYFQPFQYFGGGYIGGGRVVPASGATLYVSGSLRF